ncbi:MAG: alanine racemase [Robiginitomaculum sp.]|nr:MAG: alanine racemase [Robiginitomaculum sp.]
MRDSDKRSYSSRPVLTINLTAIADNYKALANMVGTARIGASVKADGYGLGLQQIGRTLYGAGCRTFFVAHAGEGKLLRQSIGNQPTIYVFSGPAPQDSAVLFGNTLKPVINSLSQARDWVQTIEGVIRAPRVALHFDTGLNRLGIPESEASVFAEDKELLEALNVDLVMSHLACSSTSDHPKNKEQLDAFRRIAARMPMVNLSLANTGGIYLGKPYHFKLVRPGIGLYGGVTTDNPLEKPRHVVELHAPVLQIKNVKKGDTIGYDATFTAPKDMKIAIVSAGYADGLPVSMSGSDNNIISFARLGKNNVPVIGRISMDYTILDITDVDKFIQPGEKAVFYGANLDKQAQQTNRLNYEILTNLGQRCKRVYIRDGDSKDAKPKTAKPTTAKPRYDDNKNSARASKTSYSPQKNKNWKAKGKDWGAKPKR